MLLLLEIIGEYNKIENKSKFGGKLSIQDFFVFSGLNISYFT